MENISFILDDKEGFVDDNIDFDINALLNDFEQIKMNSHNHGNEDAMLTDMKLYDMNFNVKQLTVICDYYDITKNIRMAKMKKQDIIEQIILFENTPENFEIVMKRKELWYYIGELKNDKIMKKYILWN